MIRRLLFLLFLAAPLVASDCTCLAFSKLSILINKPVSYQTWYHDLMPDGKTPELGTVIETWNKHFPTSHLLCVYTAPDWAAGGTIHDELPRENVPYVWIGLMPTAEIIPDDATCHMSICYFKDGKVLMINCYDHSDLNKMLNQTWDYQTFFNRTIMLWRVDQ